MLKVGKLPLVMIILTFLLPFGARFLKPPKVLDDRDLSLLSFEVPQEILVTEKKHLTQTQFPSPFREDRGALIGKGKLFIETVTPKLSLIYKGRQEYALLENEIKKEGDTFKDFMVEEIMYDKILLKTKRGGKKIWVNLD
ncbi:MAG: hypothetical protein N2513_06795 [Deltaproteobacteria bacterium]|nr:hypothetical protein [Deltaproteobacteria bacterium]